MNSFDPQDLFDHSPLASTEEKSLHDNIDLNKQSLEKGLKNRPAHNVLVARGILRNPGKAFSDKMSQLDLAKKRDKLKAKIANRPEREELVRKLILQEQNDNRQRKLDQIKQRLDDSINNRPGSLELVGKNILQVDRLLASRIQCGEITYPKVIDGDGNISNSYSSNHSTPLPSISEIDIPTTLTELSDLQLLTGTTSTKSSSTKNLQYKKTYRVGRYSFHNIEFRPAAQKAREYQQNELVQFEEIQAQRNPNLKRLHSELTTKSHHPPVPHHLLHLNVQKVTDNSVKIQPTPQKQSLLNRLNVHELKSECKKRLISCSNIPKVQLVEKLLPYETEILASHTTFDYLNQTCVTPTSQCNRRSMPLIKSSRDFSPPDSTSSNLFGNSFNSSQNSTMGTMPVGGGGHHMYVVPNCAKLIHCNSEPLIQNYIHNSQTGCGPSSSSFINEIQFLPVSNSVQQNQNLTATYVKFDDNDHYKNQLSFDHFNQNNSYSSQNCHATNLLLNFNNFSINKRNFMNVYEPENVMTTDMNSVPVNNVQSIGHHNVPYLFKENHNQNIKSETLTLSNPRELDLSTIFLTQEDNGVSQISGIDKGDKFEYVTKEMSKLITVMNKLKVLKLDRNTDEFRDYFNQYTSLKTNLIKLINDMIEFVNNEVRFKTIGTTVALNQQNWLKNLLFTIENNFQSIIDECTKMNIDYSSCRLSDDITKNNSRKNNNNNNIPYLNHSFQFDDMTATTKMEASNHKHDDYFFLESFNDGCQEDRMDHFNLNDLNLPTTPLTDFMNSPLNNDEFDDIMYDLLNVTENVIS